MQPTTNQPQPTHPAAQSAAATRRLYLVKTKIAGERTYEVRQYPSAVDAVLDALLRHGLRAVVAVRALGGVL